MLKECIKLLSKTRYTNLFLNKTTNKVIKTQGEQQIGMFLNLLILMEKWFPLRLIELSRKKLFIKIKEMEIL